MNSGLKRRLIIVGVAFVIFMGFVWKWSSSASFILGQHWELKIPNGGTEMYCINDAQEGGKGAAYYAFWYEDIANAEEGYEWGEAEGPTNDYDTYEEAATVWMGEAGAPESLGIEITDGKYYYEVAEDGSELIVFLDGNTKMLHIVENIK